MKALSGFHKIAKQARARYDYETLISVAQEILTLSDWQTATKIYHLIIEAAGNSAGELALSFGHTLGLNNRYGEAAEMLEVALRSLPPSDARAALRLADICERLGKFERARELAEHVLSHHSKSVPAHRIIASVARQQGRLEEAHQALAALDYDEPSHHWEIARAWYERGKVHDSSGEYAQALSSWRKAKEYYPKDPNWKLFQKQALFIQQHPTKVVDSFTDSHLCRWKKDLEPISDQRIAILTGHPRSGTTLLEQGLDAHPNLVSAEETSVFSAAIHGPIFEGKPSEVPQANLLDQLGTSQIKAYRKTYLELIRVALGGDINGSMLLDKNPDLLQLLPSFLRVFPEARIIVALRDPRDLLVSMFSQALPPNHNSICHLTTKASAGFIKRRLSLWLKLRELVGTQAIEVRYEELVEDFESHMRKAVNHLGLNWDQRCAAPWEHARQKVVTSPSYSAVRSTVYQGAAGRWKHYESLLGDEFDDLQSLAEKLIG